MCRALYSFRNGDQVSKKKAAEWVKVQLPEWSAVIKNAMDWKEAGREAKADEINLPKTVEFVMYIRSLILEEE
jgi:hypothetical protein